MECIWKKCVMKNVKGGRSNKIKCGMQCKRRYILGSDQINEECFVKTNKLECKSYPQQIIFHSEWNFNRFTTIISAQKISQVGKRDPSGEFDWMIFANVRDFFFFNFFGKFGCENIWEVLWFFLCEY